MSRFLRSFLKNGCPYCLVFAETYVIWDEPRNLRKIADIFMLFVFRITSHKYSTFFEIVSLEVIR